MWLQQNEIYCVLDYHWCSMSTFCLADLKLYLYSWKFFVLSMKLADAHESDFKFLPSWIVSWLSLVFCLLDLKFRRRNLLFQITLFDALNFLTWNVTGSLIEAFKFLISNYWKNSRYHSTIETKQSPFHLDRVGRKNPPTHTMRFHKKILVSKK